MSEIVGSTVLDSAVRELDIDLAALVAACTFWVPNDEAATTPADPKARRARSGETRRATTEAGIRLDDNTRANQALKSALKHVGKFRGFAVCHIWPKTCYYERYHTLPANLVLLPRELAGLTDHNQHIEDCLKYRAWELYGWHPDGESEPKKPVGYPGNWRPPAERKTAAKKRASNRATPCEIDESLPDKLPIELHPADSGVFRDAFLHAGSAVITVHYANGQTKTQEWKCRKLARRSNVIGNLRSRPDFRPGVWRAKGISKVSVHVESD
jgi:hypothetical protein